MVFVSKLLDWCVILSIIIALAVRAGKVKHKEVDVLAAELRNVYMELEAQKELNSQLKNENDV